MVRMNCKSSDAHFHRITINSLRVCFLIAFLCIMAGCQTVKLTKPFSAADVLPETDSMYVKIPVETNKDMCGVLVDTYIAGLTEKNKADLLDRSQYMYASVNFADNSINAAVVGDFPVFIDMVFTKKNGWETRKFEEKGRSIKYYESAMGFKVAVIQNSVMLVSSSDVQVLLRQLFAYEDELYPEIREVTPDELNAEQYTIRSKKDILSSNGTEISFYTSQAGLFIESIIGNGITLAADIASGDFSKETENVYVLDMAMTFTNKHALKPALFLFKKAQPSGQIETEALSELSMKCTGMNMDIKTIVSLLIGG